MMNVWQHFLFFVKKEYVLYFVLIYSCIFSIQDLGSFPYICVLETALYYTHLINSGGSTTTYSRSI